jgi:hypothetical protein
MVHVHRERVFGVSYLDRLPLPAVEWGGSLSGSSGGGWSFESNGIPERLTPAFKVSGKHRIIPQISLSANSGRLIAKASFN